MSWVGRPTSATTVDFVDKQLVYQDREFDLAWGDSLATKHAPTPRGEDGSAITR